jgi:hypothetical protein
MLLLTNLHENELERQLQNMTPIVSNIILHNLLKLSENDVSYFTSSKPYNFKIAPAAR